MTNYQKGQPLKLGPMQSRRWWWWSDPKGRWMQAKMCWQMGYRLNALRTLVATKFYYAVVLPPE